MQTQNFTPKPKSRKPPKGIMIGVGMVLVLVAIYVGNQWLHQGHYVSTDDAQVSSDLITVSARVSGKISGIFVSEGQVIKKGQILVKLDDDILQAQFAQAKTSLDVAQATLNSAKVGVGLQSDQSDVQLQQATAALNSANGNVLAAQSQSRKARADLRRADTLYNRALLSPQSYEAAQVGAVSAESVLTTALNQAKSAQEAVKLAHVNKRSVDVKQGSVDLVKAQIKQAEAGLRFAQLQLDQAVIVSPVDGVVVRKNLHVGEQVSPGQGICYVSDLRKPWVSAMIQETDIRRVRPGSVVKVHIDAYPKRLFNGRVLTVSYATGSQFALFPAANTAGNFTKVVQRIPVKIGVDDPRHELKLGMSAVVDIDTTL